MLEGARRVGEGSMGEMRNCGAQSEAAAGGSRPCDQ